MNFVPVATPQNESELAVMVSLLEAHGIQHYVHNQGFGGLYPGLQIELYNARRVMVPVDQAEEAFDLLSVFSPEPMAFEKEGKMTIADKMRILFETLVFGWSFPVKRKKINETGDEAI